MSRGLKLKQEVVVTPPLKPRGPFTTAEIWVDASVYHLDSPFTYIIPGNLAENVKVGSLVLIPFNGRQIVGAVISLAAPDSTAGMKSIISVVGEIPLLSEEIIDLISDAARRYAAHPFDLIRSAIPTRIAKVESRFSSNLVKRSVAPARGLPSFLQLPPHQPRAQLIAKKIAQLANRGGTIAVFPDTREVESIHRILNQLGVEHTLLHSQLSKSEYFSNFLKVRTGQSNLVIGTRSAIFAPVFGLQSIAIYNEGSEHLYEERAPGWNLRDIALLRRHNESCDLFFIGYSPSSEVARLIDEEWITLKKSKSREKISVIPQIHGELLPSRAIPIIKKALHTGPVLFLAPSKGYAQAIRCGKCRSISRCTCGGAHLKKSATSVITCSHCLAEASPWQCSWCHHPVPSLAARGAQRHQHEIGVLFPGVLTLLASADHPITDEISHGIVVSTPGMAPATPHGYSAVVILEGNRFSSQPDLRASERVREMYFSHSALGSIDAPVILIQDDGDAMATALSTWNPSPMIHRELEERRLLHLPPYVRTAILTMESAEITRLKSALEGARIEARIPQAVKILGPISYRDKSSLILSVDVAQGDELISTLHEFMRRRSAAKKTLPVLRIDPYSLSH